MKQRHPQQVTLSSAMASVSGSNSGSGSSNAPLVNFRRVAGLQANLYRSTAPDGLATKMMMLNNNGISCCSTSNNNCDDDLTEAERFVLYDVDWWIDLRFADEGDEEALSTVLKSAPGGTFGRLALGRCDVEETLDLPLHPTSSSSSSSQSAATAEAATAAAGRLNLHPRKKRWYLRYGGDGTEDGSYTKKALLNHINKRWVSPEALTLARNDQEQGVLAMDVFAERGLVGMNETLLAHNPSMIRTTLQSMTLIWEGQSPTTKVLVHCTLGKDRTGMIVALCQHMAGVAESGIADEYALSDVHRELAREKFSHHFHGGVDPEPFTGAPAEAMRKTLGLLRTQYGSVDGYLDWIGFDEMWRQRFAAVTTLRITD